MKKNFSFLVIPALTCIIFIISVFTNFNFAQTRTADKGWNNLKYSIFFTHGDIENLLSSQDKFEKTMEYFAPIKISRVYLEGVNRGDENIEMMRTAADRFKKIGIEADGAMVPTSEKGGPMCYNNPDDLASLQKRMTALASVFDNIILDDWLFTICTCGKCLEGRGSDSWADYRTRLIIEKSEDYIIAPAKKINPRANVIIKYPNWYEGHRLNGYDVYNETNLFDKMAVGIETRVPESQDQHIPVYSGYIFQKWWPSVDVNKWVGSWLDNYDMKGEWNYYNAQVWQAVLANTPEIILWCAGQLTPPNPSSDIYPHFTQMLPEFDKVAGLINGAPRGVPVYLPYGSTGEYNIFGYLGQLGIPLTPVAEFPSASSNAIFTLHSLQDKNLADKLVKQLKDGKDIFLTYGLWQQLQDSELKNVVSLLPHGGSISTNEFRIREGWQQHNEKSGKPITFPRIQTTTWPYVRDVAVVDEDYDYAVLMRMPYLNGTIYILNLPDNYYDLFSLPAGALEMIRRAFYKELKVTLTGKGNVIMYLFGDNQFALYSMNDKPVDVSLKSIEKVPVEGWKEIVNNNKLTVKQDSSFTRWNPDLIITTVETKLEPFKIQVIQAP